MRVVIANAFSLNMLDLSEGLTDLEVYATSAELVREEISIAEECGGEVVSIVGHADTAALLSAEIGREVQTNRVSYTMDPDDVLLVGQYQGPRLPEGTKELPAGAKITWVRVTYG